MKTRIKMLKVKIKSLAEEARIIRLEERRALGRRKSPDRRKDLGRGFAERNPDYYVVVGRDPELHRELHAHRVCELQSGRRTDVRAEQRASLLAYAFLRGRPLAACEPRCETQPDWERVLRLAEKFGPVEPVETKDRLQRRLAEWRAAAAPAA